MQDEQVLQTLVRERLTPERYYHSLCVQKQSAHLAQVYGADVHKAQTAGLLHDICRCMTKAAQLQYLQSRGILLDTFTMRYPQLWHAVAGSVWLREELEITDTEILDAVRYHTTARAGMSMLEQVVYLADVTSEDRDYPDVSAMRALADCALHAAMHEALCYTMAQVVAARGPVVPDTWAAYNEYAILCGKECKL